MWALRNKKPRDRALTALSFDADGVGAARIRRSARGAPTLDVCDYRPVRDRSEWPGTLTELVRAHALAGPCTVLLDHEAYALLLLEAPAVPDDELAAAARWRVGELLDFDVDDAVIDAFRLPVTRSAGGAEMMYVVAAPAAGIAEQVDLVRDSRLDLQFIDIAELCQRNLATRLAEDVDGLVMVQVGRRCGLVTLTRGGDLHLARRLGLGTAALEVDECDIVDVANPEVADWVEGLMVEVQRSLDYHERNFAAAPISRLVVAPMWPRIQGLAEHLRAELGMHARAVAFDDVVALACAPAASSMATCAGVVGAALRHGGEA